jgi:hypothetical protein
MQISIKTIGFWFLFMALSTQLSQAQTTCEPIRIVGEWQENISNLTSMFRGPFTLVFTGDGIVEISQFSDLHQQHFFVGEGKYSLDNMVDPTQLTITDFLFEGTEETTQLEFNVIRLDFQGLHLFGFLQAYVPMNFKFRKTYPSPTAPENAVASREDLYKQLLTISNTPEAVFDYFNDPHLPEKKELTSLLIDAATWSAGSWIKMGTLILSTTLKSSASADRRTTYVYFRDYAIQLCGEIGRIEMNKLDHWKRWEYVRAAFPSAREGSESLDIWIKEYDKMNQEQERLEKLRKRLLLELVLLKAEDGSLEDIYRN